MAYRSSSYLAAGTVASAAIPVPSGATDKDVAVAAIVVESSAVITPPSGFFLKDDMSLDVAFRNRLLIYWKRLTGADSGTWTFSWTGSAYREASAGLFSGIVESGDPFDDYSDNQLSNITPSSIPVNGVWSNVGNDLVGFACNYTGGSWTPPSGMTERQDTGADLTLVTADNVAAGFSGNKTFTCQNGEAMKAFLGSLSAKRAAPSTVGQYALETDGYYMAEDTGFLLLD